MPIDEAIILLLAPARTNKINSLSQENPSKHPIIILKDVSYSHLQAILEFMYAGEVNVSQEQLPAFLKTADRLKVKGLAETPSSIKREGWFAWRADESHRR